MIWVTALLRFYTLQPVQKNDTGSVSWAALELQLKMVSAKQINEIRSTPGISVWQRNYYEHVIRNEDALDRIRLYIAENPARWMYDRENAEAAWIETKEKWAV